MTVTFVRQGEFMLLQFNSSCEEARPVCQSMCCRMRRFYSAHLTEEEAVRFRWQDWAGTKVLEGTETGDCFYLKDGLCSVYEERPKACREWHCSPQGGLDDPDISKREQGWVLFPAREVKS